MLGKDLFKVQSNVDLSLEHYRSLVLFYNALIGNDAHYLYEFLLIKGNSYGFEELNKLLNSLNYSIDNFERCLQKLNEYKLVHTYKKKDNDTYIFVLNNPLTSEEFIKDDLFVRDFILKTSGLYYQSLIADIKTNHISSEYEDVSAKYNPQILANWTKEDESFLKKKKDTNFRIDSYFKINDFLKDMSTTLFPLKYRTEENLVEIARLADLYNISIDKMRIHISKAISSTNDNFDKNLLRYLCQNSLPDYHYIAGDIYEIPCLLFLMNKQEGKEVSPYDKKILFNLAEQYNLKPGVINVLLEYALINCNNRLLEKYLYPIASDLHRNNIDTAKKALAYLDNSKEKKTKKDNLESYDNTNNPTFDEDKRKALRIRREQNG